MLKKMSKGPRMALFDRYVAQQYGLETAVVLQELIQDFGRRYPEDLEHGVMNDNTYIWYRFDDERLTKLFPYLPLSHVKKIIDRLEAMGWLICWRSFETDIIWITVRGS